MKQARFIQLIEVQKALYALDEEGQVWRFEQSGSKDADAWMPLSSKRHEEPSHEPVRNVGFVHDKEQ